MAKSFPADSSSGCSWFNVVYNMPTPSTQFCWTLQKIWFYTQKCFAWPDSECSCAWCAPLSNHITHVRFPWRKKKRTHTQFRHHFVLTARRETRLHHIRHLWRSAQTSYRNCFVLWYVHLDASIQYWVTRDTPIGELAESTLSVSV